MPDKHQKSSPAAVIILGMHRSGTSALAGVMAHLGVHVGSKVLAGAADDKFASLWENVDVVATHDRLLDALGLQWDSFFSAGDGWWERPETAPFKNEIAAIIRSEFSGHALWLVKDPRMCRLLPLWLPVLKETGHRPLFILMVRNPVEVAASHERRDYFSQPKSLLLWLDHILAAERWSRGFPRVVVTYDQLLDDWKAAAQRVAAGLNIDWLRDYAEAEKDIAPYLQPGLRHHRQTGAGPDFGAGVPGVVTRTYQTLVQAASETSVELETVFDTTRSVFADTMELFLALQRAAGREMNDYVSRTLEITARQTGEIRATAERMNRLADLTSDFAQQQDLLFESMEAMGKTVSELKTSSERAARTNLL